MTKIADDLQEEQFADVDEEQRSPLDIPPSDRKLVTHPYDFIVRSLVDQIEEGDLILADKFQRRHVWDEIKSSRLIESLLLNVPIPVCYFAELEQGSYAVIDGQQRLTAIYRFLKNEFELKGLRIRTELNRCRFHQLDVAERRLIGSRSIRCIVILGESHQDIRFDVFERLNTNSVRLNAQELRNSVFRGALNESIKKLSEDPTFMKVRNVKDIDKRMRDCELILRFFAFHFESASYKGYLASFLDSYLAKGAKFNAAQIQEHEKLFLSVVGQIDRVFENQAYRRFASNRWENLINRPLFDIQMLSFARLPTDVTDSSKEIILSCLKTICEDKDFDQAITSGTQTIGSFRSRTSKWWEILQNNGVEVPPITIGADRK